MGEAKEKKEEKAKKDAREAKEKKEEKAKKESFLDLDAEEAKEKKKEKSRVWIQGPKETNPQSQSGQKIDADPDDDLVRRKIRNSLLVHEVDSDGVSHPLSASSTLVEEQVEEHLSVEDTGKDKGESISRKKDAQEAKEKKEEKAKKDAQEAKEKEKAKKDAEEAKKKEKAKKDAEEAKKKE